MSTHYYLSGFTKLGAVRPTYAFLVATSLVMMTSCANLPVTPETKSQVNPSVVTQPTPQNEGETQPAQATQQTQAQQPDAVTNKTFTLTDPSNLPMTGIPYEIKDCNGKLLGEGETDKMGNSKPYIEHASCPLIFNIVWFVVEEPKPKPKKPHHQ
jgi:hypothetical protein